MASSLDLLQHQPIRFGFQAETCANNDNRAYCNLIQDGDIVQAQLRRTLGTQLGCSILDEDATQLATNPDFTASSAGWSLNGGWTWDAGGFVFVSAGTGSVRQTFAAMVNDAMYKVTVVTSSTVTTAALQVTLSGVVIGSLAAGTLAGTYDFYGVADTGNTTFGVQSAASQSVEVTTIGLYRVAECYTFNVTSGTVSYDPTLGLAIDGTVTITIAPTFEPSAFYSPQVTLHFADYQTGTLTFSFDDAGPSDAMDASNGDFVWTMNSSVYQDIEIVFTDFIGTLETTGLVQLSSDYYFALYDLDGVFIRDLNALVRYCGEYIHLSFTPQDEGMAYGCYKIGLYDPYLHEDQSTFSYDFTTLGVAWATTTGTTWALTPGVGYEFTSTTANGTAATSEAVALSPFKLAWIKLRIETGTVSGAGAATAGAYISNFFGPPTLSNVVVSDTIYRTALDGDATLNYTTPVLPTIFVTGATAGDVYTFENAYYKIYPYHVDYYSNCFNYLESHPCSKVIYTLPGENLGFNTNRCSFEIVQRFRILRINPSYKISGNDFIASDGTRLLISGQGNKVYTLLFDYMDEVAHDVVQTIILSKEVWIGDDYLTVTTNGTRYFVIPQDYTPEWEKNGKLNLAMGRIELIEYDQVKFTTNCGN